jgi:hypothetical protein
MEGTAINGCGTSFARGNSCRKVVESITALPRVSSLTQLVRAAVNLWPDWHIGVIPSRRRSNLGIAGLRSLVATAPPENTGSAGYDSFSKWRARNVLEKLARL